MGYIAYQSEFIERILLYLDTQPHRDVRALIDGIRNNGQGVGQVAQAATQAQAQPENDND